MSNVPMGKVIRVNTRGGVDIVGIDYGNRLSVEDVNNNAIVIRVPGQTAWASVGQRAYHSPMLLIFQVEFQTKDEATGTISYHVDPMIELDLGRKKKVDA